VVMEWNSAAEAIAKIPAEHAIGRALEDVFVLPAQVMEMIRHVMRSEKVPHAEQISIDCDGEARLMEASAYPLTGKAIGGAVLRLDDVTRRVRMEQFVVQSQKMTSMGALAAGMAHEINNPLAGMMQNAQVVLARTQPDVPANR